MLQGVQRGYNLPELITLEQYQYIRDHKELDPVLAGFVGFGCSFGGKWYGGYARNKTGTNYALQSKRSLLKDMATLQNAEFVCGDYRRLCIPPGSVIYADPPYNNTTGYGGEKFDTIEFWIAMQLLADTGHTVFVSEQVSAPGRFCSFSPNRKCRKMAGKGVQPLDNYTCRFCLSSLKQADKSGLDRLQAGKLAGV